MIDEILKIDLTSSLTDSLSTTSMHKLRSQSQRRSRPQRDCDSQNNHNSSTNGSTTNASTSTRNSNSRTIHVELEDPTDTCCFHTTHVTVTTIHSLQFTISLLLIGYSIAIAHHPPDPQHALSTLLTLYSSLLLSSSILGTIGLAKNYCHRIMITLSAYIGILQILFMVIILIILIIQKDALYHYFKEKCKQLFMSEAMIEFWYNHVGLIYFGISILIFLDVVRFTFLRSLREDLLLYDEAKRLGYIREPDNNNNIEQEHDDNHELSTPLLGSNNDVKNWHQNDTIQHHDNSQWWVDDDNIQQILQGKSSENNGEDDNFQDHSKNNEKSWFSLSLWRKSQSKSSASLQQLHPQSHPQPQPQIESTNSVDSSNVFAPIEADIEFQNPITTIMTITTQKISNNDGDDNNHHESSSKSWYEDDDDMNCNDNNVDRTGGNNDQPDLSWMKES